MNNHTTIDKRKSGIGHRIAATILMGLYHRGDPRENEGALREALPALYLSFRSSTSKN